MTRNRLDQETSPYLLQHADNPVHWQPWGAQTLALAREQNRPVLLSIGYAACHWCHVMAHESFEDEAIAALMNERFVNIKVDREERPDLDTIYQHALQLLGQQGGWPLTMFLTPDGEPFWGGTYFPPDSRHGRPGFRDILAAIADFHRDKPDTLISHVSDMRDALAGLWQARPGDDIPIAAIDGAAHRLAQEFDRNEGGIRGAPKFPNPTVLDLLWRSWRRNGDTDARDMVVLTLDKMSQGGIYDHLGGGYARYSTDEIWLAPHFEKMLYDNAQIIALLTAAWRDTQSPLYAARVSESAGWVLREMIAEGGGFAATLDADSEGEEGRYYVWTAAAIERALGDAAALLARAYDVTPSGNWEQKTILHRNHGAGPFSAAEEEILADCRARLLAEREARIRPGWDDKVLADWNGLMIAALADAGMTFAEPAWIDAAVTAFRFIVGDMTENGRLMHGWRQGRLQHSATLDDYACMAHAAIVLHEVTGEAAYVEAARGWVAVLDAHYWDDDGGGYFFTADDAEALIVRSKSAADNATPSGNGIIAGVLARLYYLTGEDAYRARGESVVKAFSGELARNLFPLAALLNASETLQRTTQIAIIGARGEADTDALLRAAFAAPAPTRLVNVIAPDAALPRNHPAHGKKQDGGGATAYVCVGQTCSLPLTEAAALMQTLV